MALKTIRKSAKFRWCSTLTYSTEQDASKVMMCNEKVAHPPHLRGLQVDCEQLVGMDFIPSLAL